jgi:deoxyribose-phosphate aldolase
MELPQPLNRYIDHTQLKPDATVESFQNLLREAIKYNFASVCVSPHMALPAVEALQDYPEIKVCTVVGFPHGNLPFELKFKEAEFFVTNGVDEIDFVANIGFLKSGLYDEVGTELEVLGAVCQANNAISKCIIETCYLDEDEKTFMFRALDERTSVNFIKTSTGFGPDGANVGDVLRWHQLRQPKENVGDIMFLNELTRICRNGEPIKIKAAGGIRDLATALKFISCGADRLGMSASVKVMEEWNARNQTFIEGEEKT